MHQIVQICGKIQKKKIFECMKSCKFNGNTLDVQIVQIRRKIQWNSMKIVR